MPLTYKRKFRGQGSRLPVAKRRRYYKKRPVYPKRRPMLPMRIGGLSKSYKARLRYVEEVTVDPAAGAIASVIFRANDLYDPFYSGTGHQPYGFDQLMSRYDHFTVIASRCMVQFVGSGSASNAVPGYFLIHLNDGTITPFSNISHMLESPDNSRVGMGGTVEGLLSGKAENIVSKGFSMKKFFRKKVGDDDISGTSSASPSEGAYFHVLCASAGGAETGALRLKVTIDYIAVFTEPRILAQS